MSLFSYVFFMCRSSTIDVLSLVRYSFLSLLMYFGWSAVLVVLCCLAACISFFLDEGRYLFVCIGVLRYFLMYVVI